MKPRIQTFAAFFIALAIGYSLLARPGNAQEIKREALLEGAKREGKLQIYALLVVSDHMQIIQRFKEKYPFIDVALYRATSERLFTRIETEARANTHLGRRYRHQRISNVPTRQARTAREI